jgi:hypothetical protein
MLKRIIIILLALLATVSLAQKRYYHETGAAILRVDEKYPGAFAEHRYIATGSDNLFRAFLAFGDDSGGCAYGSAHIYEPFYTGTFSITDSLRVFEFFETIIDTDSTGAPVDTDSVMIRSETLLEYADFDYGIRIMQLVVSEMDTQSAIYAEFAITNERATAIGGLRAILFYDGDVPDDLYIDDYPLSFDYLEAVGVRDGDTEVSSGFCGLKPDSGMIVGAWKDWVDSLVIPDSSYMDSMVYRVPEWPADSVLSAGDWSSYGLWLLPTIEPWETETIAVSFIVAGSGGNFELLAASVRGDSVAPVVAETDLPKKCAIRLFPNPFNSSCSIEFTGGQTTIENITIYDISGRSIRKLYLAQHVCTWDGKNDLGTDLPSGIYLFAANGTDGVIHRTRAVLIR